MKVILKQDIKGKGKKGQMIEAAEGYARNFLIPQGHAKRATKAAIAEFETRRAELDLTRELSTFTEDIFTASIRITITALGMDISVGSWSQGSSGEIIIQ